MGILDDALSHDGFGHLEEAGHALAARAIVIDDIYQIRAQLSQWIADALVQVVLL